jgi:hypothetical protein
MIDAIKVKGTSMAVSAETHAKLIDLKKELKKHSMDELLNELVNLYIVQRQ